MRRSLLLVWVYLFAQPCFSVDLETTMRCGKDVGCNQRPQLRSFQSRSQAHVRLKHEDNSNSRSSWRAVLPSSESSKAFECVRTLRGGSEDPASISRPAAEHPAASPTVPTPISSSTLLATTDTVVSQTNDLSPAVSSGVGNSGDVSRGMKDTARVLGYFLLWYALNVWYNIVNKKVLNALDLPIPIAVLQLGIGSLWVTALWTVGIRNRPGKLTSSGVNMLSPVAFFHGGGQLATVLSLGAGAVSFTHVVKAMEPFFSALVAAVCFRQVFRWQVYASLIPVVAGVALACAKEINFSWLSFLAAMVSNLLFACRANFSKALMNHPPTQGAAPISSANLYGLVTLTAFVIFTPVAAVAGWGKWRTAWEMAMRNGHKRNVLAFSVLFSGISHYLNNEVMYLALGSVHPTTLAVGNTMKRVFIIVASLIVFKTRISRLGIVGSAIAVGGVLVYSLTKQHFDALGREKNP